MGSGVHGVIGQVICMGAEAEEELARPSTAADGSAEMMLPDRNDGGYQTGVARRRAMYLRASGEERGNRRRRPIGGARREVRGARV